MRPLSIPTHTGLLALHGETPDAALAQLRARCQDRRVVTRLRRLARLIASGRAVTLSGPDASIQAVSLALQGYLKRDHAWTPGAGETLTTPEVLARLRALPQTYTALHHGLPAAHVDLLRFPDGVLTLPVGGASTRTPDAAFLDTWAGVTWVRPHTVLRRIPRALRPGPARQARAPRAPKPPRTPEEASRKNAEKWNQRQRDAAPLYMQAGLEGNLVRQGLIVDRHPEHQLRLSEDRHTQQARHAQESSLRAETLRRVLKARCPDAYREALLTLRRLQQRAPSLRRPHFQADHWYTALRRALSPDGLLEVLDEVWPQHAQTLRHLWAIDENLARKQQRGEYNGWGRAAVAIAGEPPQAHGEGTIRTPKQGGGAPMSTRPTSRNTGSTETSTMPLRMLPPPPVQG